jgi:hypothetical protein
LHRSIEGLSKHSERLDTEDADQFAEIQAQADITIKVIGELEVVETALHNAIDAAHLISANYLVALQTAEIDLERYSAAKSEYLEVILAGLEDVDSTSAQVQAQPS